MFDELEQRIERAMHYDEMFKIALRMALGFWRDYRRANGIE